MTWTELKLKVPVNQLEQASAIAQMVIPYGIYIEDYSRLEEEAMEIAHIDLIDEELLQRDRDTAVIHIYLGPEESPIEGITYLQERLGGEKIPYQLDTAEIQEQDWESNWKQYFKPTKIGKKLIIVPSWETVEEEENRKQLRIDPGAAFGTGTHATTKLCMELLEDHLKSGDTVLDIGTGSGILSIAALLLDAKSTLGVDIDAVAVRTATENGKENGFIPPRYRMIQGNLTDCVEGSFDIVIANIVADVIINLAGVVPSFLKSDAKFIMSGIVDIRLEEVKQALSENGFVIEDLREQEGWVAICARHS